MANVDELKEKEMEMLQVQPDFLDLESLIIDGDKSRVPVTIQYGDESYGVFIRPLTSSEWKTATMIGLKDPTTTSEIELCKLGLYNKSGDRYPDNVIENLPGGIVTEIAKQIAEVSGITVNEKDNAKIVKEMMGF